MVSRLIFDLAVFGAGVIPLIGNADMAGSMRENKGLTEREYWAARVIGYTVGLVMVCVAVVDLVFAVMARPMLLS